jgi:hypothetical protein
MTGRLSAVPDLPPDGPDGPDGSGGLDRESETDAGGAATFRVRCPDCGPQIIPIAAVRFVQTRDGGDPSANRYVFTCPQCRSKVRRPAGPELAEILRASGVATLALHRGSGEPV